MCSSCFSLWDLVLMKPLLYLLKREVGRSLENPKIEVLFVVVDSDISKTYPLNFICVLPLSQRLYSSHSAFRKLFGDDTIPLAKKLLTKALAKESDSEIKTEIRKRLKHLNLKTVVQSKLPILLKSF
jgi:hypothetical protein